MEQLVRILLTTFNYKMLRKERKRRNSGHQEARKTAKAFFLFLLPNSQSDDLFNSEAICDGADIQNTATVILAMWVSTITVVLLLRLSSTRAAKMRSLLGLWLGRITSMKRTQDIPRITSSHIIFIFSSSVVHSRPMYVVLNSTTSFT